VTLAISTVNPAEADDREFVAALVELVNGVYAGAEQGLWQPGADRTKADELADLIRAGELVVARLDGRLVGAMHLKRLAEDLGELGMLVASPEYRGIGVGRQLVRFAEEWARREHLATMQLEVLFPRTWKHPVKEFLDAWYTRMGYRRVRTGRFADDYPALQPLLATPCDFTVYHKNL
jgi:GNAT superfamily N-acetyltransferase